MDFAQIAATTATWISPFLPYLLEPLEASGKKFGDFLAENGGKVAWETALDVWNKVFKKTENDPKIKGAAMMLSAEPSDQTFQAALAKALAAQLENDPSLAKELIRIFGGEEATQKILANNSSRIEKVVQEMTGGGTQIISADNKSNISGVKQISRKRGPPD